jgi:hypothetical protein
LLVPNSGPACALATNRRQSAIAIKNILGLILTSL